MICPAQGHFNWDKWVRDAPVLLIHFQYPEFPRQSGDFDKEVSSYKLTSLPFRTHCPANSSYILQISSCNSTSGNQTCRFTLIYHAFNVQHPLLHLIVIYATRGSGSRLHHSIRSHTLQKNQPLIPETVSR